MDAQTGSGRERGASVDRVDVEARALLPAAKVVTISLPWRDDDLYAGFVGSVPMRVTRTAYVASDEDGPRVVRFEP